MVGIHRPKAGGSVLILAVWTLLFLSVIAVAVGARVSSHMDLAWNLSNRAVCYYSAKAGVEAAEAVIRGGTNSWIDLSQDWNKGSEFLVDITVGEGVFTVFHVELAADGRSVTNFGVIDEDRKVNINAATNDAGRQLVRSLIEVAGGIDAEKAEGIAACIADWIDKDDEVRERGSESGQGPAGNQSIRCHNGRIDFLEELLLVKDVDTNLFVRIAPYLRVYGTNMGVNINTADPVVLRALAGTRKGVDREVAARLVERILEFRKGGGAFSERDKKSIRTALFGNGEISGNARAESAVMEWLINHRLIAVQSRYFYGISQGGLSRGSAAFRRIAFVYDGNTDEIRAWNEQ